ncbi:MAG: hypothetical protein KF746_17745 [Chitinophagaceae bacterium]|nr:hypothetical protein [Chitinophagaceae bacterium]
MEHIIVNNEKENRFELISAAGKALVAYKLFDGGIAFYTQKFLFPWKERVLDQRWRSMYWNTQKPNSSK